MTVPLSPPDRRAKDGLVETVASSKKATLAEVLPELSRDRLKDLCRALGLDDGGREKSLLVERLAESGGSGHGAPGKTNGAVRASVVPEQIEVAPGEKLTIAKLEGYLWSAADILRGSIDSSDYKGFIFGMLFLKRLSDRFDEECDALRSQPNADPDDPDEHDFFVPKRARWSEIQRVATGVGEALNKACAELEQKNDKLEGVLAGIDFNDERKLGDARNRDSVLSRLVQHFSRLDLRNANLSEPDMLGRAYEYLIEKFPELRIIGNTLDAIFDRVFADRSDEEREAIKKKYANEASIAGAPKRVEAICLDLVDHFTRFIAPNKFKAQIVTCSREVAALYKETLDRLNAPQSAIIISGSNKDDERLVRHHIQILVKQVSLFMPEFEDKLKALKTDDARASEMEHALRHEIHVKLEENPAFFTSLRERLEQIIEDRKAKRIDAAQQLKLFEVLTKEMRGHADAAEKLGLSETGFAIYGMLHLGGPGAVAETKGTPWGQPDEAKTALASVLEEQLEPQVSIVDWSQKDDVQREMRRLIKRQLRAASFPGDKVDATAESIVDLMKRRRRS